MALNLAQTSFKVIDFGTNRNRVYIFLLVVTGQQQLGPYIVPFQIYGVLNVENRQFCLPRFIPAKIWGVPFGVDPSCCRGPQRVKWLG